MSFSLFRRKSRMIYIITGVVIIPAFIFLYGSGRSRRNNGDRPDVVIGQIEGESVYQSEFYKFRRHLGMVLQNGVGVNYYISEGANRRLAFLVHQRDRSGVGSFMIANLALVEAKKMGLAVPQKEIGDYIRTAPSQERFRVGGVFNEKRYLRVLRQEYKMTPFEYKEAVRKWLLLCRFQDLMNMNSLATWETAYAGHAQQNVVYQFYKVHVPATKEMEAKGLDILRGVSKENPKGDDTLAVRAVESYLAEHEDDRRFWTDPKWRLEYVFAPFSSKQSAAQKTVSKREILDYYEKKRWLDYNGKVLDDVREQVQKDLLQSRKEAGARNIIETAFEYRLSKLLKQAEGKRVTLQALLADAKLKQFGLRGGTTGSAPQAIRELESHADIGSGASLRAYLSRLDGKLRAATDLKKRDEILTLAKNEFDHERTPLTSKTGCFRVRILAYIPGAARSLRTNGIIDQALKLDVVMELQKIEALKLAETKATEIGELIKQEKTKDIVGLELLSEKLFFRGKYRQILSADLREPIIVRKGEGYDVFLLTDRKMISREKFNQLPLEERKRAMRDATITTGHLSFRGVAANPKPPRQSSDYIHPGPRFQKWLSQAFQESRISFAEFKAKKN